MQALDSGLSNIGVPYSYGFAIILLTVLVKALTFPLSKKQVCCRASMQAGHFHVLTQPCPAQCRQIEPSLDCFCCL